MRTIRKIKSKLFVIGCGAAVLMAFGCSKDNPLNPAGNCFDGKWAEKYTSEFQALSIAATAYSENPTSENCADYKNATKGYLSAIDDFYDCIPTGNKSEIDQAIKEAKANIDKEGCDNL